MSPPCYVFKSGWGSDELLLCAMPVMKSSLVDHILRLSEFHVEDFHHRMRILPVVVPGRTWVVLVEVSVEVCMSMQVVGGVSVIRAMRWMAIVGDSSMTLS
jgi:hypothetical protein